jgi:hypothetical protein
MMPDNKLLQVAPCFDDRSDHHRSEFHEKIHETSHSDLNAPTTLAKAITVERPNKHDHTSSQRTKRRKGGWRITTGMKTKEALEIKDGIHRLNSVGKPFTAFVTIRPPNDLVSDRSRQDWCRRKSYNFRRKLMRRGLEYIALAVNEKPIDGKLHLHLLIHIPSKDFSLLKKMESLPEIDVRPCEEKHLSYVLKNRLPTHPDIEFELRKRLPRKKAAPFRGRRWSFSKAALSYIKLAGSREGN